MQHYDSLDAPDCEEWLALDEQERIALARDYHGRARIRVPNAAVHAAVHAIVETQIALGDETPARRTAQRHMDEGLDRHEAIHAIGSVLVEFMTDLMKALRRAHKAGFRQSRRKIAIPRLRQTDKPFRRRISIDRLKTDTPTSFSEDATYTNRRAACLTAPLS
jgi:hypothetical protein